MTKNEPVEKGGVSVPLPPELVDTENSHIITPKAPMEFEREQEAHLQSLRRKKGISRHD